MIILDIIKCSSRASGIRVIYVIPLYGQQLKSIPFGAIQLYGKGLNTESVKAKILYIK